jgi:hypothetical protein
VVTDFLVSGLTGHWPSLALDELPPLAKAADLAAKVRELVLGRDAAAVPLRSLRRLCRAGRFEVFEAKLSASRGMQEALLVPLADDRFAISVDPTPCGGWDSVASGLRSDLRRHRMRFRIAHEIGHSFFYARAAGEVPTRLVRGSHGQEDFCDEFARALLVPPTASASSPATAHSILDVQRAFDVSLEVAARAFGAAHPGVRSVALWFRCGPEDRGLQLQWGAGDCRLPAIPAQRPGQTHVVELDTPPQTSAIWMPERGQAVAVAVA